MDILLVIDMQQGLLEGEPKHDLPGVVDRINRLSNRVRNRGGRVIFIQHDGAPGADFELSTPMWELLDSIHQEPADLTVHKTLNDAFYETKLEEELKRLDVDRLLISGWTTDLCVDATVRAAAARGFKVTVIRDAHTVSNRPHLPAEVVIEHHHWVWSNLIVPNAVDIVTEAEFH